MYGRSGADLQTIEDESVLDLSTSYQLSSGVQLRLQVNNLANEPLRTYLVTTNRTASAATTSMAAVISST